ncbi:THO complex subunit 2 [Camellia lanceoleosa]|uniref:THO complex subunit 2 n=1 Tax=Camellia lanceoleosa TaxID=1840588 RepID=A0ACC0FY23_9ERIC|nr:THO complex subunit 2 [Camellia lanceoleosa]
MSLPPLECICVTEECIREWKNGNPSFKAPNPVPVLRFLYELCWTVVRGELPFQKCKAALDSVDFLDKVSDEEMSSNFADVVTQMAQDLTMPGEYRARLIKLAKWLVESALVPLRLFQERCEEEFLWESEMIKIKAADLKSKEVRVNTRLLYQQTKFNLLREESEGYAKLVTLLCQGSEASTQNASAAIVGIIKSLIGHFDLDPNRVFDTVLECFELRPDSSVFLDLIPIFPKSHASQILGFKFQYYQRMEVNCPVPFGLYQLTALLVKKEFIDLDSIYAHLLPKDDEAFEHYNAFSAKRLDEANKIGKINLAAIGKDLMDDEKQGDVTIDLFAALDMESEAVTERASELENNQTLGLLTGFLSVNDWYHAHILFDRLSPLNPAEHVQICNELFRLIEKNISPAYDLVRQTHLQSLGLPSAAGNDSMETNSSVHKSVINLPKELFQMLSCAGPFLYRDTLLLQKVCRVVRSYYLSALELVSADNGDFIPETGIGGNRNPRFHLKEARLRIEEALGACLLPSLQLIPANPAVGQEIWEVMNLLPYEARYRLYGEWEKDDERIPMVLAARQTAKLDTRRILKRLAKENLKQLGRMVAKLAHANPMTVLRTIVHQIEAYRDMITPVVDAFKYLTQLEYDVLEYVVIERLAQGGREKLKDDGLNLSDWLQSLASFWGHLCKKYPSMELRGLFQYLVNQLKKGNGIELLLLQELIQQMANVQYTENMTEEQLDAMAGSDTLRYQATSFGMTRNNKALIKSTNRLRDSLLPKDEPKLAIPLLLLIAQHRSVVVINADVQYIKMVSEQFDRCHGTLLQYVEFLCSAVTPTTAYGQLIPPLDDLVHLYHLDAEVAFLIYRPVMRLFKCQTSSDVFWPLDNTEAPKTSIVENESELTDSSGKLVLDLGPSRKPITWSDLLDTVRTMLPSKAWNSLSPDLYATFWGLTLYDLYVPRNRYESEIVKQHAALKALEELSDNSSSAITKRKKDKERIQESLDRLTSELQKHEENVASVRRRLAREKDKWLSSCPDTLKINMEFLQRCIFPRCTFSMPDAVYCSMFVHTLHSLGTPFFNTVNHIDVLICKTLQPMICCCTEYEVGRLGRFLCETLKIAYHWKSDESIYERECGNMPGFAVYYRDPNSLRVTYSQFIKVHWKWSQRITRLLIQCLESAEYMEIRNALIMLTKISSVFPVTRKSGINLEKRVAKIKSDEREDLKVLATGVAAALAARKPSWVTDDDFGMGFLELKPAPSLASKSLGGSSVQNVPQNEPTGGRVFATGTQHPDSGNAVKDQILRTKPADGRLERTESASLKPDLGHVKLKGGSLLNGSDAQASMPSAAVHAGTSKSIENQKQMDESTNRILDENVPKVGSKTSAESQVRGPVKRPLPAGSLSKQPKQDLGKDDSKSGKSVGRISGPPSNSDRDLSHPLEGRQGGTANISSAGSANGNVLPTSTKGTTPSTKSLDIHGSEPKVESGAVKASDLRISAVKDDSAEVSDIQRAPSRPVHSPRHDNSVTASKSVDKPQKRASPAEDLDRLNKRRKGEADSRDLEGEVRFSDRERSIDPRLADKHFPVDVDKSGSDEQIISRATDKPLDRSKDKGTERHDRDYRERLDRSEKSRGDDIIMEKSRDRSMERYGRERSVERGQDRGSDRSFDRLADKAKDERIRDDRSKLRYNETSAEKSHVDDRFHGQNLPPPPPLPPHMVPQSVNAGRRDEDADRRFGTARHTQRLSPRHEDRERRRSEENTFVSQDDAKRRREEDFRDRKREEREVISVKVEEKEREREREKTNPLKEDMDANASKRRKLKREHLPEAGEYSPAAPPPPPVNIGMSQPYDGRDRADRKGTMVQRPGYLEEPGLRIHGKEATSKMTRRDTEPTYDRDWDDEKRQRAEPKRRHRK